VNWETKFGLWVRNHGVDILCQELDVTKNAIYHWIAGRSQPRAEHCQKMIELSHGGLSLKDILDHAGSVQQGDPVTT
jgi:hypothetical protein